MRMARVAMDDGDGARCAALSRYIYSDLPASRMDHAPLQVTSTFWHDLHLLVCGNKIDDDVYKTGLWGFPHFVSKRVGGQGSQLDRQLLAMRHS
jgi:hypothetical protein